MKRYLFISFLFCVLLSGCVTKLSPEAWLTKETKITLPSSDLGQPFHDQQLLIFKHNNQENSLITLVDAEQNKLTVAGLSTMGIRLFKIEYNNNEITTEQNILIKELPPATQVLSDIMLSIWPTQQWQAVLPANWLLIDEGKHRKLLDANNQIIIDITYAQEFTNSIRNPIHIQHNIFGYQINIKSME